MLKFIKRYWPTTLAALILLTAATGVYAKYVVQKSLNGSAKVTAELGNITLLEHKPLKDDFGKYTLGAETVTEYTYDTVIPGLDIPKDPHVVIFGVTADIPVYVFIQVETDTLPNAMTYTLDSVWQLVDGHNNVYVYSDKDGNPVQVTGNQTIYILESGANAVITVSQELLHYDAPEGGWKLTFSACMAQATAGTPAVAYAGIPTTP